MCVSGKFVVVDEDPPRLLSGTVRKPDDAFSINDEGGGTVGATEDLEGAAVCGADRRRPVGEDGVCTPLLDSCVGRDHQDFHVAPVELFRLIAQLREVCVSAGSDV